MSSRRIAAEKEFQRQHLIDLANPHQWRRVVPLPKKEKETCPWNVLHCNCYLFKLCGCSKLHQVAHIHLIMKGVCDHLSTYETVNFFKAMHRVEWTFCDDQFYKNYVIKRLDKFFLK